MGAKQMVCAKCVEETREPEESEASSAEGGQQAPSRQLSRRNFIKMGVGALGALAALEMGAASVLFLRARSLEGKFGGVVTAGLADTFPVGSVTEFVDAGFFLIRDQEGGFLAVSRRCPHLGCTVDWLPEERRFLCPCHASTFDFYGNHENPPVPRPLDTFEVQIEEGAVKVDTSQPRIRQRFAPEQLAHV
jgi:cytochrome b6-f complex iron-sulfur subunit